MQDHGVDRVSLLQLKQEFLHSLDRVVATQVDHHLLDLKQVQIYSIIGLHHIVSVCFSGIWYH